MTPRVDTLATYGRASPAALACVELETGRRWNYGELHRDVDRAAAWLVDRLGPASGARVATLSRNSVAMLLLQLACARAGAVFVPFNWRLAAAEIDALVADCTPAMIFLGRGFEVARFDGLTFEIEELDALVADAPAAPPASARRSAELPATLLYTSGTSGRPKGVIVTESNIFWNCVNFIYGNGVGPRSVFLCDMPMFHTAGLLANVRAPLQAGGAVLISRGFDAPATLARLADPSLGITHYFSVPQMAQQLWRQPGFDPSMLRGLEVYAMGGAPNPAAQIERFLRAGVPVSDGFGMSETGSTSGMPLGDSELVLAKSGSCGLLYVSIEGRVVDGHGRDLPDGETGELWLRGPSVTPGYWNKPDLTAEAFSDGWFRTGDAATRDGDGFYFLVDRRKDMFISGGENVYPAEVEAALAELESIAEVAVIGVPDARWGEVGRAYVILAPGASLSEAHVVAHCRERLASFKAPASVVFTDTIPRTASGKAQKNLLKARAHAELAQAGISV